MRHCILMNLCENNGTSNRMEMTAIECVIGREKNIMRFEILFFDLCMPEKLIVNRANDMDI